MNTIASNREAYDINALHPIMKGPTLALAEAIRKRRYTNKVTGRQFVLEIFEGFRHPLRQNYLLTSTKSTKAGPWQSDHQYGFAVDFAGRPIDEDGTISPGVWNWDEVPEAAWVDLKSLARIQGLDVPIKWDRGHVAHPLGARLRRTVDLWKMENRQ